MIDLLEQLFHINEVWDPIKEFLHDLAHYDKGDIVVAVENEEYRVEVHRNHRYFVFHRDRPDKPVPCGLWIGFWDPDLKEVLGITSKQYRSMTKKQQMEADAKVQLNKYVHEQYWGEYARAYYPDEWRDKWNQSNQQWKQWISEVEK